MNKTIAQQLNVTDFPFIIRDKQGNEIYIEYSNKYFVKREFDSSNNIIYWEDGVMIDNLSKDDVITLNGIKYQRIDE